MLHTIRSVDLQDETIAELGMIVGFDNDLAGEATARATGFGAYSRRSTHRQNGFWGPRVQHPAVLKLLNQFGYPAQIRGAGRGRLVTSIRPKAPRMAKRQTETSLPRWTNRPSSSRAPPLRR